MQPFVNPNAQLAVAFGITNPALVGKFDKIISVKPAEVGSYATRVGCNSHGMVTGVGFRGSVDAAYNRINLTELMGAPGKQDIVIRTRQKPTSTVGALALLNRKWKMELNKDNILDLPIAYDSNGVGTVTVTMKEGMIEAFGTFTFKLAPGPDNITTLPLYQNIGYGLYPNKRNDIGQALLLSYPADCTGEEPYLSSLWAGQPIDQLLCDKVSAFTGIQWILAAGQYSLAGAQVTYVGPVRVGWDIPKPNFTQVAIITLGAGCSNFAGELVFYFNPN